MLVRYFFEEYLKLLAIVLEELSSEISLTQNQECIIGS